MTDQRTTTRAHCNACGGDRNHIVLHQVKSTWTSEDDRYGGTDSYETLQCAGCDSIKLRHTADHTWEGGVDVTYFPPPVFRQRPRWHHDLIFDFSLDEDSIATLLNEIYVGLQNNLTRSPVMAARSLLERVMLSKVGDKGTFKHNVDAFLNEGYVSKLQAERLIAILEAGHAATHRDYQPTKEDIITIVDIVEHVIESVYLHDQKVKALKERTPKRER